MRTGTFQYIYIVSDFARIVYCILEKLPENFRFRENFRFPGSFRENGYVSAINIVKMINFQTEI
jgi:hypothetical protein